MLLNQLSVYPCQEWTPPAQDSAAFKKPSMTALAETVAAALGGTGHRAQYLQQPGGSDVATEDGGGGGSAGEVARGSSVVVIARWPWNASVGAEDGDLHFAVGELIELDVPSSADGWGSGRLVQRLDAPSGLFPLSYVEELPPVVGDSGGSEAGARYRQRPADAKMAEKLAAFGECAESIRAALDAAVVGQAEAKQAVLLAILCREHVYIEGPPGVAKTLTAEVAVRAITIYRRMPTSPEPHHEPSKREATSPLPPTQTEQRQPLRSRWSLHQARATGRATFFYQFHRDTRLGELVGETVILREQHVDGVDGEPSGGEVIRQLTRPGGVAGPRSRAPAISVHDVLGRVVQLFLLQSVSWQLAEPPGPALQWLRCASSTTSPVRRARRLTCCCGS